MPAKELPLRAGYSCIGTSTPLNESPYEVASGAVDCHHGNGSHEAEAGVRDGAGEKGRTRRGKGHDG